MAPSCADSTTMRPPGPGPGTQHAVGVGAGVVEQVGQPHQRRVQGDVALPQGRGLARRSADGSKSNGRKRSRVRMCGHRRLVRVESMSSLVVITLLFIS